MIITRLAFDRSMRTKDADGRLHVELTPISKACVNGYRGDEIPNATELGLQPTRIYQLLRDPDELRRGAPTFAGLQILSTHAAVSAADLREDLIAGAVGTDVMFDGKFLRASITIWRKDCIEDIESGSKRELSCAYRYTPDMTPGLFNGQHYDGIMRGIIGNHLAIVEAGRAGADVLVADGRPVWIAGASISPLCAKFPSLTRIGCAG